MATMDKDSAARELQRIARGFSARLRSSQRIRIQYVKFVDEGSGAPYYYHVESGESQWHRPRLLLGPDLPFEDGVDAWASENHVTFADDVVDEQVDDSAYFKSGGSSYFHNTPESNAASFFPPASEGDATYGEHPSHADVVAALEDESTMGGGVATPPAQAPVAPGDAARRPEFGESGPSAYDPRYSETGGASAWSADFAQTGWQYKAEYAETGASEAAYHAEYAETGYTEYGGEYAETAEWHDEAAAAAGAAEAEPEAKEEEKAQPKFARQPTRTEFPAHYGQTDPSVFLTGPFCRRRGKGRQAQRAVKNVFLRPKDERKGYAAHDPSDVNPKQVKLGEEAAHFDGMNVKNVYMDAYAMIRAAAGRSPNEVIAVMAKYIKNQGVIKYGLDKLSSLDFEETSEGNASKVTQKCIKVCFSILGKFPKHTEMQSCALNVLASIAYTRANRIILMEEKWAEALQVALRSCRKNATETMVYVGAKKEKLMVEIPTSASLYVCLHVCRILSQLSYDVPTREMVADLGIPLTLEALKFTDWADAPSAVLAMQALYNFVYRCEEAHFVANEEKCGEYVEKVIENLGSDDEVMKYAYRARAAMAPDGWRGMYELENNDV